MGGEVTNLLFNYFEVFNEGIISTEAEMRGSVIKCGERQLEGGWWCYGHCGTMNDGAMETVEYMTCRNIFGAF